MEEDSHCSAGTDHSAISSLIGPNDPITLASAATPGLKQEARAQSVPNCRCPLHGHLTRLGSNHSCQSASTLTSASGSTALTSLRGTGSGRMASNDLDENNGGRRENVTMMMNCGENDNDNSVCDAPRLINERELVAMHQHIPGLRSHDPKTATIRQHYYPEGGWGWLVCACAFVLHVLTTGLQLSYGTLYLEVLYHFGDECTMQAGWLGAVCLSTSLFLSPFVVAVCRRKSTRLTAVFGGLVMALACLFTSFAHQMHQVFLSYGLFLGAGIGLARESSNLMVGQYFKRRRDAVDIVVQTGSGIGTALFSVFFREAIGSVGWRLGLQSVTGVLFLAFVLGMCYRSASLYHPQRRAILHLKNQKRKVKDKNRAEDKPSYFDFTTVKTRTLQILMLSTAISALGIYTPIIYLALHCKQEGLESSSILLLQTFMGFAFAVGTVGFGLIVVRQNDQCMIARQYLCQASLFGLATAILALGTVQGYHGYVLFAWIYGIFLGGYHYSLKVYTYEKARARYFARAWGFVQWSQSLPVLFGVPITGYINQRNDSRTGFYFASTLTFVGACALFLMNFHRKHQQRDRRERTVTFSTVEGHIPYCNSDNGDACACHQILVTGDKGGDQTDGQQRAPNMERLGKSISFATSVDAMDPNPSEYLGCISEEGLQDNYVFDGDLYGECITSCNKVENFLIFSEFENDVNTAGCDTESGTGPLPPQACLEESLCRTPKGEMMVTLPDHVQHRTHQKRGRRRSITVVEEMTTSV